MSGIFFFVCSILAISALFIAPKISDWLAALRWQQEFRSKRKTKGLCPSRDQKWWVCLLISCRQLPLPLRVRLHQIRPWTSGASGRLGSRVNIAASSVDAASASYSEIKGCVPWRGWRTSSRKTCRMREKEIQEKLMILNLSHGVLSLLLKIMKLVGNHLQEDQQSSCLQNFRKVKVIKERLWITSLPYRQITSLTWMTSTTWSEKSIQDQKAILWKISMWIWLNGEYLWMPLLLQQFISELTMTWIWEMYTILLGEIQDNFSEI